MKNKVISLFLAAAMVLSLCPASVRAQTVSEEFSAKVAEAAETETVEGTADPTEEPVVTGNTDTAETDTPQATEAPEETEVVGTGKDEKISVPETAEEKTEASGDSWKEDEELKLYSTADQDANGEVRAASSYDLGTVISKTVSWKQGTNGTVFTDEFLGNVSSTNTDWTVVFLRRLGIQENYDAFLTRANTYVKGAYDKNPSTGLSTNTPTEWHRLTMAVLAAGGDPTNVGGHDLIADGTYNCLAGDPSNQGMNGAAWALLALDSNGYEVPAEAEYTREKLINDILKKEVPGGGWSMNDTARTLEVDITAMVVYALAPHASENPDVQATLDRALKVLRDEISEDGDYASGSDYNCESTAQVIIALTSMGIDPTTVTNASSGKNPLDGLMKYYNSQTGGFFHKDKGSTSRNESDIMPTDQAMEAIAAYRLYQQGINLFDFRANANTTQYVAQADNGNVFTADAGTETDLYVGADVKKLTFTNLPIGNYDAAVVTVDGNKTYKSGLRGADGWTPVSGEIAVKDGTVLEIEVTKQNGTTENRKLTVRTSADAETKAIIDRIDKLPDADKLTPEDADTVTSVKEAYDKLTDKEKSQVTNAGKLEELVKKLAELEKEEEKKLEEKRSALEKKVAAIATPVKIGDKELINQYLLELDTLGEWDKKESLSKTLNGYLGDIAARKKLVDVLDKDIWNQVDPLRICQDDTATLKKLMSRYAALREDEKKLLQNGESLLEAADVIEALDNGIVPKKVFENLMATKEAFTYTGTLSGGSTYTLTWDGKTVKKASDVKAGIKIGTGSNTINGTQAQVEFSQSGSMNGTATLSVKTSVKDGSWNLYWLNPDKLTIQSAKTATVSSGKLKMNVTTGGRYWLASSAPKMGEDTSSDDKTTKVGSITSSKSSGKSNRTGGMSIASIQSRGKVSSASGKRSSGTKSSNKSSNTTSDTTKAKTKGKITSKELKSIKGKDENLQASGKISDSVSYTLTINGEDVKLTKDWTYKLQSDCKYKDDIEQLAVKPLILCTEGSGTFPGQMLVTLKTELDDDDLLLFSYDTENRKAEYVKKVSVKDGKMEFTLKEGGHYFIAKRALASSLDESTDAEKQEIQDASDAAEDVPWDASEETVVLGNGDDTDTGATTAEKKTAMVRWGLIGLIALVCCAAIGVVVYNKRKEKGKPDLSKEKDRKDGGK